MSWRGDEEALYRDLAPVVKARLRRILRLRDDALIEEACSRAWEIFIERQANGAEVRRDTLLGWLTTVAKHESYRLLAEPHHEPIEPDMALPDRRDPVGAWLELHDALAAIRELPPRMREIVSDRVRGLSYEEIAEARGRSYTNVARWVTRTNERLAHLVRERDTDDRGNPSASPQARRLDQLERQTPPYLRDTLGPPPVANRRRGGHAKRLVWRRAALLIERYRDTHGVADQARPLGPEPQDPEAARVYRATWGAITRAQAQIERTPSWGPSR